MADDLTEPQLRPLSAAEKLLWRISEASPMHFVIATRIRHTCSREQVESALQAVVARHPLLGAAIVGGYRKPAFQFDQIAASLATTPNPGAAEISELLPFAESMLQDAALQRSMLAVQQLTGGEEGDWFFLCLNHAITDARSCVQLVREFAQQLDAPSRVKASVLTERSTLAAYIPSTAKGRQGMRRMGAFLKARRMALKAHGPPLTITDRLAVPHRQWVTRLVSRRFSTAVSQRLFATCKERGVTVHAVLSGAIMASILSNLKRTASAHMIVQSPADIRGLLENYPPDALGMLASAHQTSCVVSPGDDLWNLASIISSRLKQGAAQEIPIAVFHHLSLAYFLNGGLWASADRFARNISAKNKSTFAFSNLGNLGPRARYGSVAVEDLTLFLSPSTTELGITASTMADRLTLNICFAEPLITRQLATGLLRHVETLIEECTALPRT